MYPQKATWVPPPPGPSGASSSITQPFLAQPKRKWRGNICACCGDCEVVDLGSCCLSYWCPCVAFGQNMRKALSLSMWAQGLAMFICVIGLQWLVSVFAQMDCGVPVGVVSSDGAADSSQGGRRFLLDSTSSSEQHYEDCSVKWNVISLICSLIAVGFLVYAAWRRTQIREKFNIPGEVAEDYLCWVCCPLCTLCQETRTFAHANVEDGVWPDPELNQPILQPPSYQQAPYQESVKTA